MSAAKKQLTQAQWHEPVEKIDWRALLSPEDLQNLAGFFDVLIEMDFEQRKQGEQDGDNT